MMKRPWQIWSLFALGLAIVIPAMAWLTVKAIELDRAESVARQQAELEESTSRALWRLDALLTPLLAQEAARPDFVYQPLYNSSVPNGKGNATKAISPLLVEPPDFVVVHFQLHPDGRISSPQVPAPEERVWAEQNGAIAGQISAAGERLNELKRDLSHSTLLAQLPDESLPELLVGNVSGFNSNTTLTAQDNSIVVANAYGLPNQQMDIGPPVTRQQASDYDLPSNQLQTPADGTQQQATQNRRSQNNTIQQTAPPTEPAGQQLAQSVEPDGYASDYSTGNRSQSRGGKDLLSRDAAYQAYAQRAVSEARRSLVQAPVPLTERAIEGVSRPLWLGDRLILARRVKSGSETLIQGCWLDWEKLRGRMHEEIVDLLPQAELTPVRSSEPPSNARLLATIPVQLSVPAPNPVSGTFSPMRISLVIAWLCLIVATVAAAATLLSVVALSERRAAFVSAVTHELRTPLTTFRMYAEMLAEGMVPETTQRQAYLETLRVEADRLHHLVENVLQYARLERGRPGGRREEITLGGLMDRLVPRLSDRATQAGMTLLPKVQEPNRTEALSVDVSAVEQILFNLVDNACKYAATATDRRLHLEASVDRGKLRFVVRDHGPGISKAGQKKLFQPFSKSVHEAAVSAPGVGLGLALCKRLARDLGGELRLLPATEGAEFELSLPTRGA